MTRVAIVRNLLFLASTLITGFVAYATLSGCATTESKKVAAPYWLQACGCEDEDCLKEKEQAYYACEPKNWYVERCECTEE